MTIFSIDFILFRTFDYAVSLVELTGTVAGMASVWLTARAKIICWPVGIINILLFFLMFYQVRLYSDMLLQVYFLVMSFYGWWKWTHPGEASRADAGAQLRVTSLGGRSLLLVCWLSAVAVILLGSLIKEIHHFLPRLFPEAAAYPYPDAFTTVFSITATLLMARKKRECWLMWLVVDLVAVVVYLLKGIYLVAAEYAIFALMAAGGFFSWLRIQRSYRTIPA